MWEQGLGGWHLLPVPAGDSQQPCTRSAATAGSLHLPSAFPFRPLSSTLTPPFFPPPAGKEMHLLRAKALECVSLVGLAVGKERFG
jgi:hypothetical protein